MAGETTQAAELWTTYTNCESHHSALFAEQKSNVLLVAGHHYNSRNNSKFMEKLRDIEAISKTQKIRLTKNHIQRITKGFRNNLLQYAPSVAVEAKNEHEYSDIKVATMHQSVWLDMRERNTMSKKTRMWAQDFVDIGECIAKVFFDDSVGKFLGYDPLYDEHGAVVTEEDGQTPVYDDTPVTTGDVVFERILGFNLLTDPDARSWEEARYVIYRKMVAIADLKKQFANDQGKLGWITSSAEETYKIFDSATGLYKDGEGLIMVLEHYYRPCADYPEGYYYISVHGGILHEGDLPLGIFPIVYCGFDEAATSARSYSIIKQLRPYQAEINRCASKIAEHQITLGDDKVILSNGAAMTPGGTAHGVKAIHVTGSDPKVFPGRTGEQYVPYMQGQISEMYQVSGIAEDDKEEISGQMDPFAILYKTARQKKPFMVYIQKFEEFLIEICKIALRYAKAFYHDEMLIPVIGKKEFVNIDEFRSTEDLGYQIKVEASTEDIESRMGKQLVMNHLIQYAGGRLEPSDIGKVVREMPYANKEKMFEDLTQDYDNWVNDRLAMDRGKMVQAQDGENHPYVIKKIQGRIKEKDFEMLPPQVQQMWHGKLQQHRQIEAQQVQEAQKLKAGYIPSGGYLTSVELYTEDPAKPGKQVRLRLPSESIVWLKQTLEQQGLSQDELAGLDQASQAQIARMASAQQQQQMPGAQQMPMAVGM